MTLRNNILLLIVVFSSLPLVAMERWGYVYHGAPRVSPSATNSFDHISLTGFILEGDGSLAIRCRGQLNSMVYHKNLFALHPLVSISSANAGKKLLTSFSAQKKAVQSLANLSKTYNTRGIHFDIENLPPSLTGKLARFIQRVKRTLPNQVISMALFPRINFHDRRARSHDYALLAPVLDRAVIMTYDYHGPGTSPGCVTDITWAEKNIQYALKYFKPDQLYLGIPAYGYVWRKGKRTFAISSRYAVKKAGNTKVYDASGCLVIRRDQGNYWSRIHAATLPLRNRMEQLARRYNFRGTALWRVGMGE